MFQVIALLTANIQVLAMGSTLLSPEPMALGTIVFSTTYVAEDIINQQAGTQAAQRGVWLGLVAQLIFCVLMLSALAYAPTPGDPAYQAMSFLFIPSVRLMCASLGAYCASHLLNVYLFSYLRARLVRFPLWMSAGLSGWSATLIDHMLFSFLAWKVLADTAIDWHTFWYSYLLPSILPRVLIALLVAPTISVAQRWKQRSLSYV